MSMYAKGRRFEYKIIHHLEENGYFVVRSAGSKGAVDVLAFKTGETLFIQAKNNSKPLPLKEWNKVYQLARAFGARAIHARNIKGEMEFAEIRSMAVARGTRCELIWTVE